jgi:hypothetical protein
VANSFLILEMRVSICNVEVMRAGGEGGGEGGRVWVYNVARFSDRTRNAPRDVMGVKPGRPEHARNWKTARPYPPGPI